MHDQTDIRLIDSHPESVRRNHHAALIILPRVLTLGLHLAFQSGMKELRRYTLLPKKRGQLLRAFPVTHINDG